MARYNTDVLIPFLARVGIDEIVPHPGWIDAKGLVTQALSSGGMVVITGAPGLGKSVLLRALRHELAASYDSVMLIPGDPEIPGKPPDVLLLDDADKVPEVLLRHLSGKTCRCILAGSPALADVAARLPAPFVHVTMRPLAPDEAGSFIGSELCRVGLAADLFDLDATALLARHATGVPLAIRTLASRALFMARLDGADHVALSHVRDALQDDGTCLVDDEITDPGTTAIADTPAISPPEPDRVTSAVATTDLSQARLLPFRQPVRLAALCMAGLVLAALSTWHLWPGTHPQGPMPAGPPERTAPPSTATVAPASEAPQVAVVAAPASSSPAVTAAQISSPEPEIIQAPDRAPQPQRAAALEATPAPEPVAPEPVAPEPAAPEPAAAAEPPAPEAPPVQAAALEPPEVGAGPVASGPAAVSQPSSPDASPSRLSRPAEEPVHIIVAVRSHIAADESRGIATVQALRGLGFPTVLDHSAAGVRDPEIGYYFPQDRPAALKLARQLGDSADPHLVSVPGAWPRPGTVKVSLPPSQTAGAGNNFQILVKSEHR